MAEHYSHSDDVLAARKAFLPQMDANAGHVAQSVAQPRSGVALVFGLEAADERHHFDHTIN